MTDLETIERMLEYYRDGYEQNKELKRDSEASQDDLPGVYRSQGTRAEGIGMYTLLSPEGTAEEA